jgi:hypothetical protein
MADAPKALQQVRNVLQPGGTFILEFANKRNLKAIFRYLLGRQGWSPFSREPVEFAKLNFDFHPAAVRSWLEDLGFRIDKTLTVSHFRAGFLKRLVPAGALAFLDSLLQWTGALWQFTPSVFIRSVAGGRSQGADDPPSPAAGADPAAIFKCPECGRSPLARRKDHLACPDCGRKWGIQDGIYDFREPMP